MRCVTWFRPYLSTSGFLPPASLPVCLALASAFRRTFAWSWVSGLYFFNRRSSCDAWFLSIVLLNWFTAGGDLRRLSRMLFLRCKLMYLGHLTMRAKFTFGWMAAPMRKLRSVFSKALFFFTSFFAATAGTAATFFLACLPLGA